MCMALGRKEESQRRGRLSPVLKDEQELPNVGKKKIPNGKNIQRHRVGNGKKFIALLDTQTGRGQW